MSLEKEFLERIIALEKRVSIVEISEVRQWHTGTAAPASGTWALGDLVWNSEPAATEYIGWVCVSAGTPGTWKGFGVIQS